MTAKAEIVVAISAEIENEQTGAIATYHVPHNVSYDLKAKILNMTFGSYVSKKAYEKGKVPVGYLYKTVPFEVAPVVDKVVFEQIIAQGGEFADAELEIA